MAKATSAERTRRIISLLGRLRTQSRVPVAELAAQMGVSAGEIEDDITTLSMTGVAPYDPWALFPVGIEDGDVVAFGEMSEIRGAVRLSASEAGALAAALQTAGFDASDPLTARLLEAAAAQFDAAGLESSIRATISAHDTGVYELLAQGAQDHTVVEIEYPRADGGVATRLIEPIALFAERGAWYVTAWCRVAQGWRTFRLDRIRSASGAGEPFPGRDGAPVTGGVLDTSALPVARLRFSADSPFIAREWSGGHVVEQEDDGSLLVDVPYAGTAWIARHVTARLGAVEAVEPTEVREAVRELAAELGPATR